MIALHIAYAIGLLAALAARTGAPEALPPLPRPPLGWQEWKENQAYIDSFHIQRGPEGREVIFPTWSGHQAYFLALRGSKGEIAAELQVTAGRPLRLDTSPLTSSLHGETNSVSFECSNGQVIPIYGHLYRIDVNSVHVTISRVTDDVAKDLRPQSKTRTISKADSGPTLLWRHGENAGQLQFDVVKLLEFSKEEQAVKLELLPYVAMNRQRLPAPDSGHLVGQVSEGDILAARGRTYRVLNVVPPQNLRVGQLVGWIELSAEPVVPGEQDRVVTLARKASLVPDGRTHGGNGDRATRQAESRGGGIHQSLPLVMIFGICVFVVLGWGIAKQMRRKSIESSG